MGCEPVLLYARPVPANLVESHQIKRDSNSLEFDGIKTAPAVAVPAEWREVLTELADDLSIELDMRYQSRSHYPSELRRYENEMQMVYRARALLQSAPQPTHSGNAADMVKNADSSAIQHHPV
jgi:hypothetical protein